MRDTKRINGHRRDGCRPGASGEGEHKRLYVVHKSQIHGRGMFAATTIPKGTRIIEYKGRRIPYKLATELYPDDDEQPAHTFLFEIDDDYVIDGGQDGNAARWINHSCKPNCTAVGEGDRIFIEAKRTIRPGEELGYDYAITLEERHTPREKKRWFCRCGAKNCRGTLLAKKR